MKASILIKLEGLRERLQEVDALLGTPNIISDLDRAELLGHLTAMIGDVVHVAPEGDLRRLSIAQLRRLLEAAVRLHQARGY